MRRTSPSATLIIAFASDEARRSVTGWLAEALATWEIETCVVQVSDETRADLEAAQKRQRMVNASGEDEISGDDLRTLSDQDL